MKTADAVQQVAEKLGIPYDVAQKAYGSAWEFIKLKMQEIPLRDNLTEEEFDKYRPNFNIPELGKFVVTWDKYQRVKRRMEYVKKLKEEQNDSKDKEY
jgi:hypothetical protein